MLESLRGLGYTIAGALADIIDNSITAHATQVSLAFVWNADFSAISILDNGEGMSAAELNLAMRLGERSPNQPRSSHDLGRFGFGLKTASFSQCRRVTVASRKRKTTSCLRWDLDELESSSDDGWYLIEGPAENSEQFLYPLQSLDSGTLVLWELLDRVVMPGFTEQHFLDVIDRVEQHLAMVFHRYLEGVRPRLVILINGKPVVPWNPFLMWHPATWSSPIEHLETGLYDVEVQCHVLPHRDRLDLLEHQNAAGPNGWTAQQGFYVYRNERLLIAGSWLGLGYGRSWTKEEAHRLARIRIDIPNTADLEWKIDIRKSAAIPPVALRARLNRLAEDTRQRARRVFAHRGQVVRLGNQEPLSLAWRVEQYVGGMRYRIDESHPAVKMVMEDAGPLEPQIRTMLRVIEESVPVQRIWLDTTEGKEVPRTAFADNACEVLEVLRVMYRNMVRKKGMDPGAAKEQLLRTEPFHGYPSLVAGLPDNPE